MSDQCEGSFTMSTEQLKKIISIESKSKSDEVLGPLIQLSSSFSNTENLIFWTKLVSNEDTAENGYGTLLDDFLFSLIECTTSSQEEVKLSSFSCIKSILSLRLSSSRVVNQSLVGKSLTTLAKPMLSIIRDEESTRDPLRSTVVSIIEYLLPPNCPREECRFNLLKEEILLPLSQGSSTSCKTICASLLKKSILQSYHSTLDFNSAKEEPHDVAMTKAESSALNCLQDWGDVMESLLLESTKEEESQFRILWKDLLKVAKIGVERRVKQFWSKDDICQWIGENERALDDSVKTKTDSSTDLNFNKNESIAAPSSVSVPLESPLSTFYSHVKGAPIYPTSVAELEGMLDSITQKLHTKEAEMWNNRFQGLLELELLLVANISSSAVYTEVFLSRLPMMNIPEQILDLRSKITRQACLVTQALAHEFKTAFSPLLEQWVPSILQLCKSGVKIMAQQGIKCLYSVVAFGGNSGFPRIMAQLTEQTLIKKNHFHVKKAGIIAMTVALRVWNSQTLGKHLGDIEKALIAGMEDRDPSVREEARKGIWAMHACSQFQEHADLIIKNLDFGGQKRLKQCKADCDQEWEESGRFQLLVLTGKEGKTSKKNSATTSKSRPNATKKRVPLRERMKKPSSASGEKTDEQSVDSGGSNFTRGTVASKSSQCSNYSRGTVASKSSQCSNYSRGTVASKSSQCSNFTRSTVASRRRYQSPQVSRPMPPVPKSSSKPRMSRASLGPGVVIGNLSTAQEKTDSLRGRSTSLTRKSLGPGELKTPTRERRRSVDRLRPSGIPQFSSESGRRVSLIERTNLWNGNKTDEEISQGKSLRASSTGRMSLGGITPVRSASSGRSRTPSTTGKMRPSLSHNADNQCPRSAAPIRRRYASSLKRLDSSLVPLSLDYFLKTVSSEDFQKREDALETLESSLREKKSNIDIHSFTNSESNVLHFVEAFSNLIMDHTMRVSKAALSATHMVLQNDDIGPALGKHLSEILVPIITKMTEKHVSGLAEECWNASFTHNQPLDIIVIILSLVQSRLESPRNTLTEAALLIAVEKLKHHVDPTFTFDMGMVIIKSCAEVMEALIRFPRMVARTKSQPFNVEDLQSRMLKLLLQVKQIVFWKYKFNYILTKLPIEDGEAIIQTACAFDDESLNELHQCQFELVSIDQAVADTTKSMKDLTIMSTPNRKGSKSVTMKDLDDPALEVVEERHITNEIGNDRPPLEIREKSSPMVTPKILNKEKLRFETPGTDPIVRYLGRPEPVSVEKAPRKDGKLELSEIINLFSKGDSDNLVTSQHQMNLRLKALVQCAKENRESDCWDKQFIQILNCLLGK